MGADHTAPGRGGHSRLERKNVLRWEAAAPEPHGWEAGFARPPLQGGSAKTKPGPLPGGGALPRGCGVPSRAVGSEGRRQVTGTRYRATLRHGRCCPRVCARPPPPRRGSGLSGRGCGRTGTGGPLTWAPRGAVQSLEGRGKRRAGRQALRGLSPAAQCVSAAPHPRGRATPGSGVPGGPGRPPPKRPIQSRRESSSEEGILGAAGRPGCGGRPAQSVPPDGPQWPRLAPRAVCCLSITSPIFFSSLLLISRKFPAETFHCSVYPRASITQGRRSAHEWAQ